jgi:glycerate-2-kinase
MEGLEIERGRRIWLFAFGKAATPMAQAAAQSLLRSLHSIIGGVVVSADAAAPPPYPTLVALGGNHPVPGTRSFAAATKIAEVTSGRRGGDVAIVLISGGTSSLIGAPLAGMNGTDLSQLYEQLLGSGLDVASMNTVRKRFSRWGAGRLALALAPAKTHCFALSDVANDDMSAIGSGPCSPDPSRVNDVIELLKRANLFARIPQTHRDFLASIARGAIPDTPKQSHPAFAHVTARVIAGNPAAVEGAAAAGRARGFAVQTSAARLTGEAAEAGETIARQLIAERAAGHTNRCFVWGGETTVTITGAAAARPSGGGRCQELALAAARVLAEAGDAGADITILAAGTDGRDGATDAAGAIVDSTTWRAVLDGGREPAEALAAHESHAALRAADALIPRRDTETNVNDIVVGLLFGPRLGAAGLDFRA